MGEASDLPRERYFLLPILLFSMACLTYRFNGIFSFKIFFCASFFEIFNGEYFLGETEIIFGVGS